MSWVRSISVALVLGVGGVAQADDVIYQYEGDVLPHDPSEGWIVTNGGCESPCTEGNANGKFFLFWPTPGDIAGYTYIISEAPDTPPRRCGSSGDSDPTTPWDRTSSAAMRCCTFCISTWWTGSISTVTRSFPLRGVILSPVSTSTNSTRIVSRASTGWRFAFRSTATRSFRPKTPHRLEPARFSFSDTVAAPAIGYPTNCTNWTTCDSVRFPSASRSFRPTRRRATSTRTSSTTSTDSPLPSTRRTTSTSMRSR